ncbi:MAG: thioredoxin family protein [Anaerolineales bacterium]|nr:thioredoxin family protein [Anaerolineales bacterium]MCS7249020.1 thioredoxin family protein [Anaerolineales bacterium]MDW8162833.1 thioredoxin family protein [Anaerolineales bacterium]MDW8446338.1 thioredoxin family protein [Anaerolineales bacterium]
MDQTLLNEEIRNQVREFFKDLNQEIAVLFFGKEQGCETCADTYQLLKEVSELSDKIVLEKYDLEKDAAVARRYHVDKAPGIVIAAKDGDQITDYGVRYAGIPAGHEFSSLIHDFLLVSSRDSGLSQRTRELLKKVNQPVLLQVFVTPSCPYCPRAVVLAHQMAMEHPLIESEMVEAIEFPELSERFGVSGVPQTTINEGAGTIIGAVPEEHLLAEILRVAGKKAEV